MTEIGPAVLYYQHTTSLKSAALSSRSSYGQLRSCTHQLFTGYAGATGIHYSARVCTRIRMHTSGVASVPGLPRYAIYCARLIVRGRETLKRGRPGMKHHVPIDALGRRRVARAQLPRPQLCINVYTRERLTHVRYA